MATYPKLKFQINRDLDIQIAFQFMDMSGGGIDYGQEKIIDIYPELSKAKEVTGDERRLQIADFTQKYYLEHKTQLESKLNEIGNNWASIADYYFLGVDKIFGNPLWPEGEYICYLSIFDCNPRFLETKSFQIYIGLSDRTNYIIAHEMLHFMFFDYLDKYEMDFKNNQNEHTIWLLSEWFNDLMLNLPIFKKFGQDVQSAYPEVAEFSKQFGDIKTDDLNIQKFFEKVKAII